MTHRIQKSADVFLSLCETQ